MDSQNHGVSSKSKLASRHWPLATQPSPSTVDASPLPAQDSSNAASASHAPLRVVFCWAEISGYMAACFRELAGGEGIKPLFIAFGSGRAGAGGAFSDSLVSDLPCRLLEPDQRNDASLVHALVSEHRPDVIVLCGWFHTAYRQLMTAPELAGVPIVMTMDTPWWGRPRQWLGRIALRRLLRRISMMVVTGERSWQYAIRLGIPQAKIRRGMYGVDWVGLGRCLEGRTANGERRGMSGEWPAASGELEVQVEGAAGALATGHWPLAAGAASWPQRFLFAGRYAPEKALDLLVAGYLDYRARMTAAGQQPWPLVCCGTGPLAGLLRDVDGITDRGFVQPDQMRDELTAAGVFVLPSRYDPWPLALVEACAAGLPVIASEACGSAVELIRPEYNGYLIATGDATALADALAQAHQERERLQLYGQRAHQFAAAYSAQVWAQRWAGIFNEVGGNATISNNPCLTG